MAANLVENDVELASLDWLQQLGYATVFGPNLGPDEPSTERTSFGEIVLADRFRAALRNLNPALPADALDEAFRKVTIPQHPSLIANNRAFHRMLVDGIAVQCRMPSDRRSRGNETQSSSKKDQSLLTSSPTTDDVGDLRYEIVRLIDFDDPDANDWLAVNQFTVIEGQHNPACAAARQAGGDQTR